MMPAYVLDTNILIDAHRRYYAFDICPGFWNWLIHYHQKGALGSIDKVRSEITGEDKLSRWVQTKAPESFFSSTQSLDIIEKYSEIVRWVNSQAQFMDAAKTEFAQVADGWVIAYAKANNSTVVTHEEFAPNVRKKVPIPNICRWLKVNYADLFFLIRNLGGRFRWP